MTELERLRARITELEVRLQQEGDRFRNLLDGMDGTVILFDLRKDGGRGRIRDANRAACKRLGYSRAELLGMNANELEAPKGMLTPECLYDNFNEHATSTFETVLKCQTGNLLAMEVNARIIEQADTTLVLCTYREFPSCEGMQQLEEQVESRTKELSETNAVLRKQIEERRKLTSAMSGRERRFNALFNHAADAIYVSDENGKLILVNEKACCATGYTSEELLGMHVTDVDPAIGSPQDFQDFIHTIPLGGSTHIASEHRRKNGSTFPVEITISKLSTNRGVEIVGIARDITERARRERELLASERKLSLVVQYTGAVLVFNKDGERLFCNENLYRMLGYTPEEYRQKAFLSHIHPDDRNFVSQRIQDSFITPPSKAQLIHYRMLGKHGDVHYLETTANVIDWDGQQAILAVGMDISERARAEEALRDSELRFRSLYERNPVSMLLVNPKTKQILDANYAACDFYGWSRVEMRLKSITDINTLNSTELENCLEEAKDTETKQFHFQHRLASGEIRDVEVFSGPITIQGVELLYSTIIDVTEKRRAEQQMHLDRERLQHIAASVPGVIFQLHRSKEGAHSFTYLSEGLRKIFAMSPEEGVRNPMAVFNTLLPEDRRKLTEKSEASARTESALSMVLRICHPQAESDITWVKTMAIPTRQPDGSTIWNGVCIDITLHKLTEEALLKSKRAAEAASQAKSQFLANMSHELRTPLNGIIGMLQVLLHSAKCKEGQETVANAIRSSTRLNRLLSDILDISMVEAGRLALVTETFKLDDILNDMRALFLPVALQKGVDLTLDIPEDIHQWLKGDPARLRQILSNLIGNAIKFTNIGSATLTVERLTPCKGEDHERLLFTVSDTGIGIEDEHLEELFAPFSQVEHSFRRKHQGAGLGLSITKRLVKLMEGHLAIMSEPGQGTAIALCLELPKAEETREKQHDENAPKKTNLDILVAEDDRVSRLAAVRMLEHMGHRVAEAENGQIAVEMLTADHYDLIFMDVQMPEMDGLEATRSIREGKAGENRRNTIIVAMTAYAMVGDRENFLQAGMNEYIAKPVEESVLREVMEQVTRCPLPLLDEISSF